MASLEEIKKAYFACAKECHPDICNDEVAHQRFQEVSAAYSLLTDEEERSSYEAGLAVNGGGHGRESARTVFDRVFKDLRFKNATLAMEERALYAVIAMKNGNEIPARDFVVDYRMPPQYCLPRRQQIEAVPESPRSGGEGGTDGADPDASRDLWYSHRKAGGSRSSRRQAEEAEGPLWIPSDHPGGG